MTSAQSSHSIAMVTISSPNIKVKVSLTEDSAPDFTVAGGQQTRSITKPKFDHELFAAEITPFSAYLGDVPPSLAEFGPVGLGVDILAVERKFLRPAALIADVLCVSLPPAGEIEFSTHSPTPPKNHIQPASPLVSASPSPSPFWGSQVLTAIRRSFSFITKPKFDHEVSAVIQRKDKRTGSLSGDFELVRDGNGGYVIWRS